MKKLFIMCAGRTGSSFLTSHIDYSEKQYNAWEFFECWSLHFFKHIIFLRDNNIPQPPSFLDFLVNFIKDEDVIARTNTVNSVNYNKFPYKLEMISDFYNILESLGYDYFIHKQITHVTRMHEWKHEDIVDLADGIILNYRKNILDVWISQLRANTLKNWVTKKYDPRYENKVPWSKRVFKAYAEAYIENYKILYQTIKESKKPHSVIEYETLCKQNNKIKFISNELNKIGFSNIKLVDSNIVKQSKNREHYEDCFTDDTIKDFKKDYHSIKHFTSYKP